MLRTGLILIGWMIFSVPTGMAQTHPAVSSGVYQSPNPNSHATHSVANQINQFRQHKPKIYRLDSGDVLGVFIEGVLGDYGSNPPVHMPPPGSTDTPSLGYPFVVNGDGAISLPLIEPIKVRGLSLSEAEEVIKAAYRGQNKSKSVILNDASRVMISLQRKRTINVTVIRQDNSYSMGMTGRRRSGPVADRSDRSARGMTLQLPAGENDLFNALIASGGLPGVNAKDLYVLRGQGRTSSFYRGPVNTTLGDRSTFPRTSHQSSQSNQLSEGDLVVVTAPPTAVFYTGGQLPGGEHVLPRDKSLNVLEAIAIAGGMVGRRQASGVAGSFPPSQLTILRGDLRLVIDLNRAIVDPSQRPTVLPGDTLILQFSPVERAGNFGARVLGTYGVYRLFN